MSHDILMDAAKAGDLETARSIADTDPACLAYGDDSPSPIQEAAYRGKNDVAQLLASRRQINLFEAIVLGECERARTLLQEDPALAGRFSYDGWTPLHLAGFFGQADIVRMLVGLKADLAVRSRNSMANTPLHASMAGKCDTDGVAAILEAGADVNAAGEQGYTPFHLAASRGNRRLAEMLIEKGANERALLEDGRTAAQIAREHGHGEMAAWLESRLVDSF